MKRHYTSVDRFGVSLMLALGLSACTTEEATNADTSGSTSGDTSGSTSGDTSGSTSGSTSGDTSGTSGGDTSGIVSECDPSTPVLINDQSTGFERCSGGALHRPTATTCPNLAPRSTTCESPNPEATGCVTDSDCTERDHGYCDIAPLEASCYCNYGCVTDADCGAGSICLCGDPVGVCAPATCTTDADCEGDLRCVAYTTNPGCGGTGFTCQTPQDTCDDDSDCVDIGSCALQDGHLQCVPNSCVIGRPFLVEGEERLAPVACRGDWCDPSVKPALAGLNGAQRARLHDHWARIGLMEHASVAAFARSAMQLMSLGAPPSLLIDTQAAMVDETQHARLAFALASAYGDAPIGPGPLPIDGALDADDLLSILHTTIHEGCIGESVAAVEAAESAEHVQDPVVKAILLKITEDEGRHAALAWKTVQWALSLNDPALRAHIEATFDAALRSAPEAAPVSDEDRALLAVGVVSDNQRADLRRLALQRVIGPTARRILSRADGDASEAVQAQLN